MYDADKTKEQTFSDLNIRDVSLRLGTRRFAATIYQPTNLQVDVPPMLALHGISRNAKAIGREFAAACTGRGQTLIVPRFSRTHWPHFQKIGAARPDKALLALLRLIDEMGLVNTRKVALFGYSGGAQLAHRFAMLYPQRISELHVAAAGWYCLPDPAVPFPMGLAPGPKPLRCNVPTLAHAQLRAFLGLPLRVYVGAEDIARDKPLRKEAALDLLQGRHRLARALCFVRSFRSAAQARGITPNVMFTELPGCAHSFTACAKAGLTTQIFQS